MQAKRGTRFLALAGDGHGASANSIPGSKLPGVACTARVFRSPGAESCIRQTRMVCIRANMPQPFAATTVTSNSRLGEASAACTVVRAGAAPSGNQASHTAFIAAKSSMLRI